MTLYKYKAVDKDGKIYERKVEVKNRFEIYAIIREEGGRVISIKETKKFLSSFSFGNLFSGIKTQQKINFAKSLGSMINAGLPVTRALSVMSRQTKQKTLKKMVSDLESEVSKGRTLSEALAKWPKVFSKLFISMVRAGEESGSVAQSLTIISGQMEKSYLLVKKVRGALIYPAVIISVMVILAALLLIFMVPTLTETFEGIGASLPLSTRVIIEISDFLINNSLMVLSGALLLVLFVILAARSRAGRMVADFLSIKIPVIGSIIREYQSAQTARTLSSLLAAGVEIVVAIDVTTDVMQNHLYKNALKRVRSAIEKGESMSAVFMAHDNLYPLFVGEMVAVGEETGKISEMLTGVAAHYEEEVDRKTKDLSTIIEPLLMIVVGIGVGFFAISMLAPTYSLVDYI